MLYEVITETWKESKGSLLSFIGMFDVFNVMMNILFVFIASTVIANSYNCV